MQKKFISNLMLMVLLNLLIKPVAIFGIDAAVQNRVGEESYGLYFALLNFSFLFNILMDLGINNFTTKSVAQFPSAASSYVGKLVGLRVGLFLIYGGVSFSIAVLLGWNRHELFLLSLLLLNQFFVTLIAYARGHFGGFLMFRTEALISILDRALLILFCGIVLYTPVVKEPFRIEWFIWIQTLAYGSTFLLAYALLIRKIGIPKISHRPLFSYAILRQSLPYALLILLMMAYTRIDSIMIERVHPNGKAEAGMYAQGFRLLDAAFMFAMIFSNLLFPIFSKMFAEKQPVNALLKTSGNLLIGGSMAVALIGFFHSETILGWIYEAHIEMASRTFKVLVLSFIGMCVVLVFGTLLTAYGALRFLNRISMLGVVANVLTNAILIPSHGAFGAACATLVTQSMVAFLQIAYSIRLFSLPISKKVFWKLGGYVGAFLLINCTFRIENVWTFCILVVAHIVGLFLFKLIDLGAILQMLKTREEDRLF